MIDLSALLGIEGPQREVVLRLPIRQIEGRLSDLIGALTVIQQRIPPECRDGARVDLVRIDGAYASFVVSYWRDR